MEAQTEMLAAYALETPGAGLQELRSEESSGETSRKAIRDAISSKRFAGRASLHRCSRYSYSLGIDAMETSRRTSYDSYM